MSMALTAACSGAPAPDPAGPAATSTAAPTATPTQAPVATAEPTATAQPAPAPPKVVYDADSPDGVRRMAKWDGPTEAPALTVKKAWVVAPNLQVEGTTQLSFEHQTLRLVDVVKADKAEVVFAIDKHQYAVPASLAQPGTLTGLKKGMAARCSLSGTGLVGLLKSVDPKSAVCAVRFLERTETPKLTPAEVLPLTPDKLSLGTPVMVRSENRRGSMHEAWVVAATPESVWVSAERGLPDYASRINGNLFKVSPSSVTPIDPSRVFKVGAPCLARQIQLMTPCKVTKIIDAGAAYVVTFDDSQPSPTTEWPAGSIAPAPTPTP